MAEVYGSAGYQAALVVGICLATAPALVYVAASSPGEPRRNAAFVLLAAAPAVAVIWFLIGLIVAIPLELFPDVPGSD